MALASPFLGSLQLGLNPHPLSTIVAPKKGSPVREVEAELTKDGAGIPSGACPLKYQVPRSRGGEWRELGFLAWATPTSREWMGAGVKRKEEG